MDYNEAALLTEEYKKDPNKYNSDYHLLTTLVRKLYPMDNGYVNCIQWIMAKYY